MQTYNLHITKQNANIGNATNSTKATETQIEDDLDDDIPF